MSWSLEAKRCSSRRIDKEWEEPARSRRSCTPAEFLNESKSDHFSDQMVQKDLSPPLVYKATLRNR